MGSLLFNYFKYGPALFQGNNKFTQSVIMIIVSVVYFILPWEAVLDEYYEEKSVYSKEQKCYEEQKKFYDPADGPPILFSIKLIWI